MSKRDRPATLDKIWGVKLDDVRMEVCRPDDVSTECDDDKVLVVDLFCGCGGFSCGAEQAGHRVVLAVDCDRTALAYHRANHPKCAHARITLGFGVEQRLLELIGRYVPRGRKWHLHGSPPCQLFSSMRNIKKGKNHLIGMHLVRWYMHFVSNAQPNTWTFENVRSPAIKALFDDIGVAYGYFSFVKYGVPQTRKRCLAGSSHIIQIFSSDPDLLVETPRTPMDVIKIPKKAAFIRASGGKNTECFLRPVDRPTWALLCACKPVFVAENRSCVRVMHIRELLRLQTFPDCYRMESHGHLSLLGKESDRVRLVGNAIPVLIAQKLVQAI